MNPYRQDYFDLYFYLNMETKNLLTEITTILEPYGIEKIILFGSYAYGTPKEDSDIDLLVIKDIPSPAEGR